MRKKQICKIGSTRLKSESKIFSDLEPDPLKSC